MLYQTIAFDVAEHILTITLNRPDKLNAFTTEMADELIGALEQADADDDIRVVIVTGAGRAFCAGADLSSGVAGLVAADRPDWQHQTAGLDQGAQLGAGPTRDAGGRLVLRLFAMLKPVIAAVNGPAVGVGATMQLPMDIRLASEQARFGFVFARRGLVPEACSSWFLPRVVGISRALEWTLSGRVFDADEALSAGLVRGVYAPDALIPAARALAREMADNTASVSVALTRQMLWRMLGASHPMEAHRIDSRGIVHRAGSADAAEGVAAFLEKRSAVFKNTVSRDMPAFFPWWNEPTFG